LGELSPHAQVPDSLRESERLPIGHQNPKPVDKSVAETVADVMVNAVMLGDAPCVGTIQP